MKSVLISATLVLTLGISASADDCACVQPAVVSCSPCASTQWYKAKDGTFREKMPYAKALDRAEDADDMEPVLKKAQADLAAAAVQTEAANTELAQLKAEKAAMEAQLAELKKQLETEKQATASQTERANKAEAAHKLCVEQVAQLREEGKKKDEALATAKGDLKKSAEEGEAMKAAKSSLEKQVADLTAAKTAADETTKLAQQELEKSKQELEKMKQEAAETKKAQVEEAKQTAEKPPEDPAPAETPAAPAPAPADPPAGDKLVAE